MFDDLYPFRSTHLGASDFGYLIIVIISYHMIDTVDVHYSIIYYRNVVQCYGCGDDIIVSYVYKYVKYYNMIILL